MRPQPYIGVTGVTRASDATAILDALPPDSDRRVMIGVLVSGKTLRGLPRKWPKRYPDPQALSSIFVKHPKALNLIHFNTMEEDRLVEDMRSAQSLAGSNCDGFQLNVVWPDPEHLASYKESAFDRKTLVLQCGGRALSEIGHSGKALADQLRRYEGAVDYVLIDPSGGAGKDFDMALALECLEHLYGRRSLRSMGFGIAGGLCATNTWRIGDLLRAGFSDFSVDAERKMRTEQDELHLNSATAFVAGVAAVISVNENL